MNEIHDYIYSYRHTRANNEILKLLLILCVNKLINIKRTRNPVTNNSFY